MFRSSDFVWKSVSRYVGVMSESSGFGLSSDLGYLEAWNCFGTRNLFGTWLLDKSGSCRNAVGLRNELGPRLLATRSFLELFPSC